MNIDNFLSPKLVGKRFDSHSIPLELLGDLAVLEDMIIDVAKWRYLQDNTDKKRSPRRFTNGVALTLTGVDEGSAVAKIALSLALAGAAPPAQQAYLEQARDAVVGAIAAAGENKPPTDHLPREALAYFDRLGRSLLDDEAIEFPTAKAGSPARLTKETRLKLLKAAEVTERTEEIHIRGGIFDLNQEDMAFVMMLPDGSKVTGPVGRQHFETFLDAFYNYRQGVKILLDGVGKFDRAVRLKKVESVDLVTLLDPLDFQFQIDELRALKAGWYDGKGLAPSSKGLDWLATAFNERYPDNLPLPYVYPVAEGGVRFEWLIGRVDVSLEINLTTHAGDWHDLHLETDAEEARHLDLNDDASWRWLAGRMQQLSGA
ncbi:hypothetical protein [Singulisphaera sp. PoT]|uniref:hypothetical protein n=1 Tax=Singulisphaera sp. PoT TaxID=3411797 RepID=UPI003BF4CD5E